MILALLALLARSAIQSHVVSTFIASIEEYTATITCDNDVRGLSVIYCSACLLSQPAVSAELFRSASSFVELNYTLSALHYKLTTVGTESAFEAGTYSSPCSMQTYVLLVLLAYKACLAVSYPCSCSFFSHAHSIISGLVEDYLRDLPMC